MGILVTGANFMVIGMSVVFLFLVIMVISMNILKVVIPQLNKFMPEVQEQTAKPASAGDKTQEVAAAIAAAYSMKN